MGDPPVPKQKRRRSELEDGNRGEMYFLGGLGGKRGEKSVGEL